MNISRKFTTFHAPLKPRIIPRLFVLTSDEEPCYSRNTLLTPHFENHEATNILWWRPLAPTMYTLGAARGQRKAG